MIPVSLSLLIIMYTPPHPRNPQDTNVLFFQSATAIHRSTWTYPCSLEWYLYAKLSTSDQSSETQLWNHSSRQRREDETAGVVRVSKTVAWDDLSITSWDDILLWIFLFSCGVLKSLEIETDLGFLSFYFEHFVKQATPTKSWVNFPWRNFFFFKSCLGFFFFFLLKLKACFWVWKVSPMILWPHWRIRKRLRSWCILKPPLIHIRIDGYVNDILLNLVCNIPSFFFDNPARVLTVFIFVIDRFD